MNMAQSPADTDPALDGRLPGLLEGEPGLAHDIAVLLRGG